MSRIFVVNFIGCMVLWSWVVNLSPSVSLPLLCEGTATLPSQLYKTWKRRKAFFIFYFFNVLYTRRPWCDRLWDLVTLHTWYNSTLCQKGSKEWIYWCDFDLGLCIRPVILGCSGRDKLKQNNKRPPWPLPGHKAIRNDLHDLGNQVSLGALHALTPLTNEQERGRWMDEGNEM